MKTLAETGKFGKIVAHLLPAFDYPSLLLTGPLGSGKTTLASRIVGNMPGGEDSEISSPSFTICNYYPTRPATLHCDLYRCKGNLPQDLVEAIENGGNFLVMEWADYLDKKDYPPYWLDISLNVVEDARLLEMKAKGQKALDFLEKLEQEWPPGRE